MNELETKMLIRKIAEKIITTALSGDDVFTSPVVYSPWPLLSAALQCSFSYGSGGTSVDVYVQTSLDGGETWTDVAQFHFLTTTATKIVNLSALTPVSSFAPQDGALANDAVKDGVLGQHWRVKMKSAGTYAGDTKIIVNASFKSAMIG